MKTKNKTAPGFFAKAASEWKGMRFFCGNELCRLDWIISVLILAFLFVTCVHSDVKLTGNRSFLMIFIRQATSSREDTGPITFPAPLSPTPYGICLFTLPAMCRRRYSPTVS